MDSTYLPGASVLSKAKLAVCASASVLTLAVSGLPLPALSVLVPKVRLAACSTRVWVGSSTCTSILTLPSKVILSACGMICTA